MKTKIFLLLAAIAITFSLTGCEKDFICIRAGGPDITETLNVPDFDGIKLKIDANVELTQGPTQSVTLIAKEEILDNIETEVKNGIWTVSYDKCVIKSGGVRINITVPSLRELSIAGSGDIWSTNTFTDLGHLDLNIAGSGNMDLAFVANSFTADIAGSGEKVLNAVVQSAACSITGSGDITLTGQAQSLDIDITGSGNVQAFEFPVEDCIINVAGSGKSEVQVSNDLQVKITGSGDVYYKGNPSMDVDITGSGRLVNRN